MFDKINEFRRSYVFELILISHGFWYGIAITMFVVALFTGKEVFALLALVAAMMKKD